jgi:hypothetical protein
MEMNLASDSAPFQDRVRDGSPVELPSTFFVDSRLAGEPTPVRADARAYQRALEQVGSRFPRDAAPGSGETRHAFLVPTRSHADNRIVERLIEKGMLDAELVADVLAIDPTTPVYSRERATLIRFVPDDARDVNDLRTQLVAALQRAPAEDEPARTLLANLTDAARTAQAHRRDAQRFLEACRQAGSSVAAIAGWLRHADHQRRAVDESDTAKHPSGSITEKGFREVFPRQGEGPSKALRLNPTSCLAEPRPRRRRRRAACRWRLDGADRVRLKADTTYARDTTGTGRG